MSLLQDAIRRGQTGAAQPAGLRWGQGLLDALAWLLVAVLVSVAALAGLRAYTRWTAVQPVAPVPVQSDASETIPQPPMMFEVPAAPAAASAAVVALYAQARAAQESPSEVAGEQPSERVPPPSEAVLPEGRSGSVAAAEQSEPTIDVDAIVAEAERALSKPVKTEHPAPFLGELPQSQRDSVPTLRYEQHRFELAQPDAALVLINGRELQAGDQLPNGVRLLEVLPDSAVFDSQGLVFRLRALSSWVNF